MQSQSIQHTLLLIHKPVGPTSHDIVARVRRITREKRVGHAGTLDPFAEGLLIVLVGREATKRQSEFLVMDKEYEAVLHFGGTSTTDDCTGTIANVIKATPPSANEIKNALSIFVGEQEQLPPIFSAKKINGKKAYELARKGIMPELTPKKVTVHSIELLEYAWPLAAIHVRVSSGTYIRALARDIGKSLGCGAYLDTLKRTSIGEYMLAQTITLDEFQKKCSQ